MSNTPGTYPLSRIYDPAVVVYGGFEDYRAKVGVDPPFDPRLLVKRWAYTGTSSAQHLVFNFPDFPLSGSVDIGRDGRGRPNFYQDGFTRAEAQAVNIPPPGATNIARVGEIPVPCRLLEEDEDLQKIGFTPDFVVVVRDPAAPAPLGADQVNAAISRILAWVIKQGG